jgi:hypothetical protein
MNAVVSLVHASLALQGVNFMMLNLEELMVLGEAKGYPAIRIRINPVNKEKCIILFSNRTE